MRCIRPVLRAESQVARSDHARCQRRRETMPTLWHFSKSFQINIFIIISLSIVSGGGGTEGERKQDRIPSSKQVVTLQPTLDFPTALACFRLEPTTIIFCPSLFPVMLYSLQHPLVPHFTLRVTKKEASRVSYRSNTRIRARSGCRMPCQGHPTPR